MIDTLASELETTKKDATSSVGKSFAERTAMFLQLMEMVEAIQSGLPAEERRRRAEIAELLDPLPIPWWKNFRNEALAEYECQTSSI